MVPHYNDLPASCIWKNWLATKTTARCLPAAQGYCQSCRHWAFLPGLKRPRCPRWEGKCHWIHLCTRPAARPLPSWWSLGLPSSRCSHRSHCSTGKGPRAPLPACACKWRSSPGGWCGTWGARMWCQTLFLWGKHIDVQKSHVRSKETPSIPTLLWNLTKKEDTNQPVHTTLRGFQNTTRWLCPIGYCKPGNSACFPTEISYSCTRKLAHKSPFMMCVVKILVAMKNDSMYYVLILLNKNKIEWKWAFILNVGASTKA